MRILHAFTKMWRGELPLATAFWGWAVAGGLAINVLSSTAFLFLLDAGWVLLSILIGYAVSVPYNFLACVGVWRSAERYPGNRRIAELATGITIGGMVFLSLT